MSRLHALILAAAATVVLATPIQAALASAAPPNVYADAVGDSGAAPDVQKITLTDGGDGTVAVGIDLAAAIPNDDSIVLLGIDADRNASTGDKLGFEYVVAANAVGVVLLKWDGSQHVDFNHSPLSAGLDAGRLTFTLTLQDLGGISTFDFAVISANGAGTDADGAPDRGVFTFTHVVAKPSVQAIVVNAGTLVPKAGANLAVRGVQVKLSTNELVAPDSLTCTLSSKGVPLRARSACVWPIPKTYRKKHLVLRLVASYQGQTATLVLPIVPR